MIVRPGIVGPSSKLATRPNDDCDVGSLLTRESRELLKSTESNALSTFFTNNTFLQIIFKKSEKKPLHLQKSML
jgi:hypothetical protein